MFSPIPLSSNEHPRQVGDIEGTDGDGLLSLRTGQGRSWRSLVEGMPPSSTDTFKHMLAWLLKQGLIRELHSHIYFFWPWRGRIQPKLGAASGGGAVEDSGDSPPWLPEELDYLHVLEEGHPAHIVALLRRLVAYFRDVAAMMISSSGSIIEHGVSMVHGSGAGDGDAATEGASSRAAGSMRLPSSILRETPADVDLSHASSNSTGALPPVVDNETQNTSAPVDASASVAGAAIHRSMLSVAPSRGHRWLSQAYRRIPPAGANLKVMLNLRLEDVIWRLQTNRQDVLNVIRLFPDLFVLSTHE